jgi:hypothetical protein
MIDTFLSDTKGHKHSFILELQRYIPMMMERAARVMDRKEGTGMNFIKFHLILHLCQDIINMGLPVNVDSEAGESNHKENTKNPANHTQKRVHVFDQQTANRYVENLAIDILHSKYFTKKSDDGTCMQFRGNACMFNNSYKFCTRHGRKTITYKTIPFIDIELQSQVSTFLSEHLFNQMENDDVNVKVFTKYVNEEVSYHANPFFKSTKGLNHGWHDWAYAAIHINDYPVHVPIHIICYLELTNEMSKSALVQNNNRAHVGNFVINCNNNDSKNTHYAVAHVIVPGDNFLFKIHNESNLVQRGEKFYHGKHSKKDNLQLFLVPTTCITGPCIAVPDVSIIVKPKVSYNIRFSDVNYIIIQPTNTWCDSFKEVVVQNSEDSD